MNTDGDIPSIVVFVSPAQRNGEPYRAALDAAGFWIADSHSWQEAVRDVVDIRPDIVIADLASQLPTGDVREFVRLVKQDCATRAVPLVLLEEASESQRPPLELDADVRLSKPCSPETLLNSVAHALAASRELRSRSGTSSARSAVSLEEPSIARQEPKPSRRSTQSGTRTCPTCDRPLSWVDRRTVDGVEYDYYDWCASGCGLYCFDLQTDSPVKLA